MTERVEAVREAVGDAAEIGVDFHAKLEEPAKAAELAQAIEPFRPMFIEEPIRPGSHTVMAEARRAMNLPVATGESLYGKHEFQALIEAQGADLLQPDILLCGGMTEIRKIAALAEAHMLSLAPHNPFGGLSSVATAHFGAATPNFLIMESPQTVGPRAEASALRQSFLARRHRDRGRLCQTAAGSGLGRDAQRGTRGATPLPIVATPRAGEGRRRLRLLLGAADMDWAPRYSVGLYHHLGMVDGPSLDQIDEAFRAVDQIPDLAGIEFFSGTCVTLDNAHQVKQRLDDRGLQCSMIHHGEPYIRGSFPWAAYTSPDAAERREAIDMCLHAVEVARALGGLGVYVFTPMDGADYPFQQDFRAARERTLDALREICAAAGDLKVALEFRPYQPRGWATVGSMSKTLEIIGELNLPNLGAQLEVSHTFMSGENAAQAAWEAARRGLLYHVHLNDTQLAARPVDHLRQQPPVGVAGAAPLAARGRLSATTWAWTWSGRARSRSAARSSSSRTPTSCCACSTRSTPRRWPTPWAATTSWTRRSSCGARCAKPRDESSQ